MKRHNKTFSAVMKVTGDYCNLRCSYCFYNAKDQQKPTVMSLKMVEKFIKEFLALDQNSYSFVWHGGEPLLAGIPFFKEVLRLQEKYTREGQQIYNGLQTNATLITKEWAQFFKANNFGVGVSLDGCAHSHDRFRIRADGSGSFIDVMQGIRNLQKEDIRFGCIQTVTKAHLGDLEENFNFFVKDLGVRSWGMNYFLDLTDGPMANQSVTPDEQAAHIIKCIDLWLAHDSSSLEIREVENFFRPFLKGAPSDCSFRGSCGSYLGICIDGEVYPCDRFSNTKSYKVGDLKEQSVAEIFANEKMRIFHSKIATLPSECSECEWVTHCNNGCAHHHKPETNGKYNFCEARKKVFAYTKQLATQFSIITQE